jgi:hypothetical protein
MKSGITVGLAACGILMLVAGAAQASTIALANFYNESDVNTGVQTPASASAFSSAGVPGLTGSEPVLAFDVSGGHTGGMNPGGENAGSNLPLTAGPLTISGSESSFYHDVGPGGSVYQACLFNGNGTVTESGLSSILPAGEIATLYVFGSAIFSGTQTSTLGYSYGALSLQSASQHITGQGEATFNFISDGSNTLNLTFGDTGSDDASFPSLTSFAIQATVPEPISGGLCLLAAPLVLSRRRRTAQA